MHKYKDARWHCHCTVCEDNRRKKVKVGCLCLPAPEDPTKFSPGFVPFWTPGRWSQDGWSNRFPVDEPPLLVLQEVDKSDKTNGGYMDVVICASPQRGFVTVRKSDLVVIAKPDVSV